MQHVAERVQAGNEASPLFTVRFTGPQAPGTFKVYLMYRPENLTQKDIPVKFAKVEAPLGEDAIDDYEVRLTPYPSGKKLDYYFKVQLLDNTVIATLPEDAESRGDYLVLRFEGIPPTWLVIVELGFIALATFTASLMLFSSFGLRAGSPALKLFGKQAFWTTIFLVLGAVVFHVLLSRAVNGGPGWGGWPIGEFSVSDTVTELVVLYMIALVVALKGSTFAGRASSNLVSAANARILGIAGFVLVTVTVLVHSAMAT